MPTWVSYRVDAGPSISKARLHSVLARPTPAGEVSPLAAYYENIYEFGVRYNVDPNLFLAVSWGENWWGTHPNSLARTNFNWASISNAAYGGAPVAGSRWGRYPSPVHGILAFFKLLAAEYYPYGQTDTWSIWWGVNGSPQVDGTHAYAPASENLPDSYAQLIARMASWADQPLVGFTVDEFGPSPVGPQVGVPQGGQPPAPLAAGDADDTTTKILIGVALLLVAKALLD